MRYALARRDEDYLILDTRTDPAKVIATCSGYMRHAHAKLILEALGKHDAELDVFLPKQGQKVEIEFIPDFEVGP